MGKDRRDSVRNDEQQASPRASTFSARRPASITDQPDASERAAVPYEDWTKAELYERVQELGIDGRSAMSKSELITALRSN